MEKAERFRGCFFGGAVGDALGYLLEKLDLKTIHKRYGTHGLRTVLALPEHGNKSIISDDTHLSLFTADGILWAAHEDISFEQGLYQSYMRWYYTQTERIISPEQADWMKRQQHENRWNYDIMGEEKVFARRYPRKNCLVTLAAGAFTPGKAAKNTCKGSSVLRSAPIGLYFSDDIEKAFAVGCCSGWITHGSPTAYLAAGFLSALIASLAQGGELRIALAEGFRLLQQKPEGVSLLKQLLHAVDEAVSDHNPIHSIQTLGLGWSADEALSIALYCLLKNNSLREAVIMACNQDGDSDTCGAVCGSIAGTLYGEKAVPEHWKKNLECHDILDTLAQALCEAQQEKTA